MTGEEEKIESCSTSRLAESQFGMNRMKVVLPDANSTVQAAAGSSVTVSMSYLIF